MDTSRNDIKKKNHPAHSTRNLTVIQSVLTKQEKEHLQGFTPRILAQMPGTPCPGKKKSKKQSNLVKLVERALAKLLL